MSERKFQAGDTVDHGPTKETWVLACDELDDGKVIACGWPETMAEASDCTLKREVTPEKRLQMLEEVSNGRRQSFRRSMAQSQLTKDVQ